VGDHAAILPSIEGAAIVTGYNTIFIDPADTFSGGFQVV
jgi:4-hydroxyproline epimerase